MDLLAPPGPVYQAGTLSGNQLATAAGLSVLRRLRDPAVYDGLERKGARLEAGLSELGRVQRVGAMLTLFMSGGGVVDFEDAQACDTERYGAYFRHLLDRGIYVAPSQFEAMFVSLAHGDEDIDRTVDAVGDLPELISLCSQLRAEDAGGDGPLWAATAALLGAGELDEARAALRLRGEAGPLEAAARAASGAEAVEQALAAHAQRF